LHLLINAIAKFIGAETTAKLIKMKVLIVGMRGIGIETAKNLALQGAGAITVRISSD
jgi:molybdopterin/thiamine biosynthesis adenylyltransferase